MIVAGLQFIADPPTTLAHALPFWSTRELGTYAIDGAGHASLGAGLVHAAVTLGLLATATPAITLCGCAVVARRSPRPPRYVRR